MSVKINLTFADWSRAASDGTLAELRVKFAEMEKLGSALLRRFEVGRVIGRPVELPDDWQDHCGDPRCDMCPPGPPSGQL